MFTKFLGRLNPGPDHEFWGKRMASTSSPPEFKYTYTHSHSRWTDTHFVLTYTNPGTFPKRNETALGPLVLLFFTESLWVKLVRIGVIFRISMNGQDRQHYLQSFLHNKVRIP